MMYATIHCASIREKTAQRVHLPVRHGRPSVSLLIAQEITLRHPLEAAFLYQVNCVSALVLYFFGLSFVFLCESGFL